MSLRKSVARGAAWMVLYRLFDRSLGLVSTLVLARLLVPADFGLVAMATSIIAILELFNAFGLDIALIQRAGATTDHYNTAWTLNAAMGLVIAMLLLVSAWPMSLFYHDHRLVPLVCVLALGTAIQGFENIGVVAFRKELTFDREFRYLAAKRILTFCVTITLAVTLRSYWALALGITFGRMAGVTISYLVHPYRPKLSLAALPDLMHFSKWVFLQNIFFFLKERSSDFIVGRIAGPGAVGVLSVSTEIASMPGTEIVAPINRAAYPAYSKLSQDVPALGHQYLTITSLVALFVTPAVAGIGALGPVAVGLLLGPKWAEATTLISLVAFVGIANVLLNTSHPAVLALGKPVVFARVTALQVSVQIPALIILTKQSGAHGAALGFVCASVGVLPISMYFILKALQIRYRDYLKFVWRPLTAAAAMYFVTRYSIPPVDVHTLSTGSALLMLAKYAPLGALVYITVVSALWLIMGRPEGPEQTVVHEVGARWGRLQAARAGAGR